MAAKPLGWQCPVVALRPAVATSDRFPPERLTAWGEPVSPGTQPAQNDTQAPEYTYVAPPTTGTVLAEIERDAMGRVSRYKEHGPGIEGSFERYNIVYDNGGRITHETSVTFRRNGSNGLDEFKTHTENTYSGGLLTEQSQDTYLNDVDGDVPDSVQTFTYAWWDGAFQSGIVNDRSGTATDWDTAYSFDSSGRLTSAQIDDGRDRTVTFRTDQSGLIVERDEADNQTGGDPRDLRYVFAGRQMGLVTNNGTDNLQFAASIRDRLLVSPTGGAFRNGATTPTPYADFEQSYDAINSGSLGGSSYTVREGDTLHTIALAVWGDASLWYKLAEANGLTGAEPLAAGQGLRIPERVSNMRNAADTFRPYDPNQAIGETSPTAIKPPTKNKCAVVGQILLVAIAVAVSVVSYGALTSASTTLLGSMLAGAASGAASSVASQAAGVATGLQDKFSWKGVGMAALGGAIGGGLGKWGALANEGGVAGDLGRIGRWAPAA